MRVLDLSVITLDFDGLDNNRLYFAITDGLSSNQVQLITTLNDGALDGSETSFNNDGGNLVVESRVSDKITDIDTLSSLIKLKVSGMSTYPLSHN